MENIREILATNLKTYRKMRGLTQGELVKKAGISIRYYQDIEKTKKSWPQPDIVEAIAGALEIDPQDLFTEQNHKPITPTIQDLSQTISEQSNEIKRLKESIKGIPEELIVALSDASEVQLENISLALGIDSVTLTSKKKAK